MSEMRVWGQLGDRCVEGRAPLRPLMNGRCTLSTQALRHSGTQAHALQEPDFSPSVAGDATCAGRQSVTAAQSMVSSKVNSRWLLLVPAAAHKVRFSFRSVLSLCDLFRSNKKIKKNKESHGVCVCGTTLT